MDLQAAFDHGFEAVKAYVDAELGAFAARIAALEARPIEKGDVGPPGPAGDRGPSGDRGEKGEQGRDGRDAADLMLIYSHITEQVAEVVAGAIKTFSINSPDSGRTLQAGFGSNVHQIKTGIPLDAGVWVERTYAAGDSVSHGGSSWIAQRETSAKPGKSDDWRLAVKRGADGRDYRPDDKRAPEPVRFK